MQTTDQVHGEAREKLADRLSDAIGHYGKEITTAWDWNPSAVKDLRVEISCADAKDILAALRAQPERGAEEMLTDPIVVHTNMLRGVIAKPSVENIVHLYGEDALRRALPLHPAKDEGGGR